ncbi:MAG: aspartate carbamoyltransferase regulatory subunit [Bacteroidales bacterium]|nr:aspartate carbamoyltransferase regulatory subunit [Bacteroidales bacterium]MBN2819648.1 aspartate carbamoyltransferase regulatory subunit [Bacteroidales bacterium]
MNAMKNNKLEVSAIKDGTVIDHIPAGHLFKVINILKLDSIDNTITFGTNFLSKRLGKKAIIKLSNVFFKDNDINRIALVAPSAKLNIIKDYKVVEKKIVEVPDEIQGIVKCVNPKCITNNEKVTTKFTIEDKKKIKLRCVYCEKITDIEQLDTI